MRGKNSVSTCCLLGILYVIQLNAQTFNFDLDGRLTGSAYTVGTKVNFLYDSAGNITNIYSANVQGGFSPTVTIQSPTSGGIVISPSAASSVTISGTASDTIQLTCVLIQLNNGLWQVAASTNGWANWYGVIALQSGTNTIVAYAQDVSGNSASSQIQIIYNPPPLWNPAQLGSNLALWLDAANTNSLTLNGTSVTQWKDLSGQGNTVYTYFSPDYEPGYVPANNGTLGSVYFDGSSCMFATNHTLAVGTNPVTFYSVASAGPGCTGWRWVYGYGSANTGCARGLIQDNNGDVVGFNIAVSWPPTIPYTWTTQLCIVGSIFTEPAIYGNYDGSSFVAMGSGLNTTANLPLYVGSSPSVNQFWYGNIGEIVAANAALGTNQTEQLEGYLAWKWGLQANLPASHPYRFAAPRFYTNSPVITFVTPVAGSTMPSGPNFVSGTITDLGPMSSGYVQVNSGQCYSLTTTNSLADWFDFVNLTPGTNTINVVAQDFTGNIGSNSIVVLCVSNNLWTPSQLGTNLALWLDAQNTNSLVLNGTNVTTWYDVSGQATLPISVAASNCPIYVFATPTNFPSVYFNGLNMCLIASNHMLATGNNPCTVYSVASINPNAQGWRYVWSYGVGGTGTARSHLEDYSGQIADVSTWGPNLQLNQTWSAQPSIIGSVFTSPNLYGDFNGSNMLEMSASMNTPSATPLHIGQDATGNGYWWGNINEIVAANAALNTNQTQMLEGYLAWKWGLQTNLPSTHPYRYAAPPIPSTNLPVITITIPVQGAIVTNQQVTVFGTAFGYNPMASVSCQVNNAAAIAAVTTNGWTNWTANAWLVEGTNQITVYGQDVAGNIGSSMVSVLYTNTTRCYPVPSCIVSWWPGNGNAVDIVGGNNGTLTDGADYTIGEVGQAFNFTNLDALVLVGNANNLQLQNFTIEGWIRRASTASVTEPVSGGYDSDGVVFGFGLNGYALALHANGNLFLTKVGVSGINSSMAITDTDFHHVAVTTTNGNVVFYLDGIGNPVGSYSPGFQFSGPAAIGGPGDLGAATFYGVVDELSVYSAALSADEIGAIYAAGSSGKCVGTSSSNSAPSITASFAPALGLQVKFSGFAGCCYVLQTATNLASPVDWQPVVTNPADANGNWLFNDTNSLSMPTRFYRVILP